MDAYELVLSLHLLSAVFLVGPAAVAAVTASGLVRAGRADALVRGARTVRALTGGSVLALLLGTGLIGLGDRGEQWGFDQLWISASYALWLVATGLTFSVVVRGMEDAAEAVGAGGTAAAGLARRVAVGGGLATLAWAAIVVLMGVKPGA